MIKQEQAGKILYICDGIKCAECHEYCKHTTDISHAKNFEKGGDCYVEKDAEALYNKGIEEQKAEREMLGSQIKVLKKRLNYKYVEIERLKAENASRQKAIEDFIAKKCCLKCDTAEMLVKEFCEQIEMSLYAEFDGMIPSIVSDKIDELLKDYGIGDEVTSRINLRLGVTEKDIKIMAKALREYAKNHPNPKCHADEAKCLAHLIEYQRQKMEE